MEMIRPARLIPGKSIIGLVTPSGVTEKKWLEAGIKILKDWGFSVKLGSNVLAKKEDYSAGSEGQRADDFLKMVSSDVDAIGCIIGGFAATEVLKYLTEETFTLLRQKPKLLFGYSDFSLILNALFSRGIIGLHAPNVAGLFSRSFTTQRSLYLSLVGELPAEIGPLFDWEPIKPGFVKGRLIVSNLQCLIDLLGTQFDPLVNSQGDLILALEEVGEEKSNIVRWLERLVLHPQSAKIKGIILGRFVKIGERYYPAWGKEMGMEQIFVRIFGRKKIPIASLPEFGHTEEEKGFIKRQRRETTDFFSLPTGVEVLFKVKTDSCRLKFLEKAII